MLVQAMPYPAASGGDPSFSSVAFLSGFEGADGVAALTEESSHAQALTFLGNAQLDTAQVQFGGSSLLLDGTGDYVTAPLIDDFKFGGGPFTVEGWFRFADVSGFRGLISRGHATSTSYAWALYYSGSNLRFHYYVGSTLKSAIDVAWSPAANTWYHLACDRDANVWRLYVNGAVVVSQTSADIINDGLSPLQLGYRMSSAPNYFSGWIDEVRITKVARYAGAFTPPVAPFPRS